MSINVVLVEPEIPQNTGNIIRTCAVTGSRLHLVKPLGFEVTDKHLKRSGLDYADIANIIFYENIDEFLEKNKDGKFYLATTKTDKYHTDMEYEDNCYLLFGKETKGLPKWLIEKYKDGCVRIPMLDNERARCLNLSNSVAVLVYEVYRQLGFDNMR